MLITASICVALVAVVGLRALPRPLAEILVDLLYAAAQRAYSAATAADAGLVAYRLAMRQAETETVRAYLATHAPGAGLEALDSLGSGRAGNGEPVGDRESEGAAVASGCPTMEVA